MKSVLKSKVYLAPTKSVTVAKLDVELRHILAGTWHLGMNKDKVDASVRKKLGK